VTDKLRAKWGKPSPRPSSTSPRKPSGPSTIPSTRLKTQSPTQRKLEIVRLATFLNLPRFFKSSQNSVSYRECAYGTHSGAFYAARFEFAGIWGPGCHWRYVISLRTSRIPTILFFHLSSSFLSFPLNLIFKFIGSFAAWLQSLLHPIVAQGLFVTLQGAGAGGVALGVVNNAVRAGGAVAGVRGLVVR